MTSSAEATPGLACYVIMRQAGKLAFVLRENTSWKNGYYSLPAGRVEKGESAIDGAIREAKEEVGVTISRSALRHLLTVHRHDNEDWLDVYFEATSWDGELTNTEPHKHSAAVWLNEADLPSNIIEPQAHALKQIAAGNTYADFGW